MLELTLTQTDWHALSNGVAFALLVAAWIGGVVLGLSYVIFFRWYRTKAGVAFMQVIASFALLLTLTLVINVENQYWGRDILRPLSFLFIAFSTFRVSWILWTGWWDRVPSPLKQEPIRLLHRKPKAVVDVHGHDHPFMPKPPMENEEK